MQACDHLNLDSGGRRPVAQPLAANWSRHGGWFRFSYGDDRWVWSPQVEQMHGYRPGTVAPTTRLVLSHVHPDDGHQVAAALYDVHRTHRSFSSCHRIVDTNFHVHEVVMVGAPFYDGRATLLGLQGLYLDLTPAITPWAGDGHREEATDRLRSLAAGRGDSEDRRRRVRAATQC